MVVQNLHRISGIKKTQCALHSDKRVFFNAKVPQIFKVATIPTEVRVTITQTRHQCPPSALEYTDVWILLKCLDIWYFVHGNKALPCSLS